jgi:hypothetical protein
MHVKQARLQEHGSAFSGELFWARSRGLVRSPRRSAVSLLLLLKQFREPTTPEPSNQSLAPKHNPEAKLTSQAACSSQLPSLWQAQHLTTPLCDQTAPPSSHVALPYEK